MIDNQDDVAIAAITAAELLVGVVLANAANKKRRAAFVERVLDEINVESYGLEVARSHAELLAFVRRKGQPKGAHDLIIGATSIATKRTVVTSNSAHFEDLPGVSIRSA